MSLPKIRLERCESSGPGLWRLDGEQKKHLTKSLRLYEGATVEGLLREGETGKKSILRLERDGEQYLLREIDSVDVPHDPLALTLLIGLLKADQFDVLLRTSAEVGVETIVPVICERSVPQIKGKDLEKKMARWRRIIDEGTKVSGAVVPPRLAQPVNFAELGWGDFPAQRYAAMLSSKATPIAEAFQLDASERTEVAFAVGPEGDWSDAEAGALLENGFLPVGLGSRILRASTAALLGCGWFRFARDL